MDGFYHVSSGATAGNQRWRRLRRLWIVFHSNAGPSAETTATCPWWGSLGARGVIGTDMACELATFPWSASAQQG
jgi:hypothetical protein